ncbi:MAG: PIN domain-containing protein [Acidobacteria bacterium]|nr:PIN domain-containing protein [Acidobacteriota bacterium]
MPLLVDTGILYALADRRDAWHQRVIEYVEASRQPMLAPITVLPEVAYLLRERIGPEAEQAFVRSVADGEVAVEGLTRRDWTRIETLMATYGFLGMVDASIVAICERLKLRTLATTDRRHFHAVRPAHVSALALVP